MSAQHDSVNPCTTLGHIYTSLMVIRCPHLESYSVSVRTWSDNDVDDTEIVFEAAIEFGPFDSAAEIESRSCALLALGMDHQRAAASL